jgi:hypothetical protein
MNHAFTSAGKKIPSILWKVGLRFRISSQGVSGQTGRRASPVGLDVTEATWPREEERP